MTPELSALLVVLDLETTGLEPDDTIIEAAWTTLAVTKEGSLLFPLGQHADQFADVDTSAWSGDHCIEESVIRSQRVSEIIRSMRKGHSPLGLMDDYVAKMHAGTGLLYDWMRSHSTGSNLTIEDVGARWNSILDTVPEGVDVHACGAGVSAFDWPRLKATLPDTMSRFHYRPIDVSPSRTIYGWVTGGKLLASNDPAPGTLLRFDRSSPAAPAFHRAKYDVLVAVQQVERTFEVVRAGAE